MNSQQGRPSAGKREENFFCGCVGLFCLPSLCSLPPGSGTAAATTEFSLGFLLEKSLRL